MSYTPTVFKNGQAPALNATEMNKIGNGIKANADDITQLNTDLTKVGRNVFDVTTITENKSVYNQDGSLYDNVNSFATDYMNISGSQFITFNGKSDINGKTWGAFYDNNKSYISGFATMLQSVNVPSGAVYVRLGFLKTYKTTLYVSVGIIGNIGNDIAITNADLKTIDNSMSVGFGTLSNVTTTVIKSENIAFKSGNYTVTFRCKTSRNCIAYFSDGSTDYGTTTLTSGNYKFDFNLDTDKTLYFAIKYSDNSTINSSDFDNAKATINVKSLNENIAKLQAAVIALGGTIN